MGEVPLYSPLPSLQPWSRWVVSVQILARNPECSWSHFHASLTSNRGSGLAIFRRGLNRGHDVIAIFRLFSGRLLSHLARRRTPEQTGCEPEIDHQ